MPTWRIATLIAVAACTAGCGVPRPLSHPTKPQHVTAAERRAVFTDWYADGRIDGTYACAVVRDAIRHLPPSPPIYSTVYRDFRKYEQRVC